MIHKKMPLVVLLVALVLIFAYRYLGQKNSPAGADNEPMELHIPLPMEIKGFDPSQANDLYSHIALAQIYEPLYQYAYLERPYRAEPLLAEEMPVISPDRLTYTIKIRKGIRFQDDPCFKSTNGKGRELTAQDVIFSFKRIADKRVNSNGWWIFRDRITGLDEFREKSGEAKGMTIYGESVDGLTAPDARTLVIRLKKPYPQLLYILTMSYTCIIPREAVEFYGEEFLNHPVGTGPFRLKKAVRGSKIVYVRNPSFRGASYPVKGEPEDEKDGLLKDAGKPIPFLDRLTFHIMKEPSGMWLEFLSGNIDYAGIPKDNYDSAIDADKKLRTTLAEKRIRLSIVPDVDITYIAFNMEDPILGKSLALRQALSLSINRQQLIHNFYNDHAIPAEGPIPPGLLGYDPSLSNPYAHYDLAGAKKKMAEARKELGLKDDDVIELTYDSQNNDITARQMDEFCVDAFTQLGLKVKYNVNTWPQFLERVKNRKCQVWGSAWGADYPDAENFLQLLYGPNSSPGDNSSNYKNPEFDRLYDRMKTMDDSPERTAVIRKMVEIAIHDVPWIFCTHRIRFILTQRWLLNYKYSVFSENNYKYYRIDNTLKKGLKKKF